MKSWTVDGSSYILTDVSSQIPKIPTAIFQLRASMTVGLYLERLSDSFDLPAKIYGNDHVFVNRVVKSYNTLPDNQGILLTGHKGGGKTLTARQICNETERPVILLTSSFNDYDLVGFLGKINQEVVILIDEYDKIFGESDKMLTLMDGVFNSIHKKLFILTKNDGRVSRFMIDRPGRIRYLKEYGNLEVETIREIVDDLLINKDHMETLVDKLGAIEIITVDIIRSIIIEMNIHDMSPDEAFLHFNITLKNIFFDLYEKSADGKTDNLLFSRITLYGHDTVKDPKDIPRLRQSWVRVRDDQGNSIMDLGRCTSTKGHEITVSMGTDKYDEDGNEIMKEITYTIMKHYLFSSVSVFGGY